MLSARYFVHYFLLCLLGSCKAHENGTRAGDLIEPKLVDTSQADTCGLSSDVPKKDTGKLVHLMNEEHDALMGARGYLIYPIENAYSEDQVRYMPLRFRQLSTSSSDDSDELSLIGDCANLTLRLRSPGYIGAGRRALEFDEIELSAQLIGRCKVKRPSLVNFAEDEHYSCRSRRMFACDSAPIRASSPGGPGDDQAAQVWPTFLLVLQDFEFEIHGKHNEIFRGKFSKKKRNCNESRDYGWQPRQESTTSGRRRYH